MIISHTSNAIPL